MILKSKKAGVWGLFVLQRQCNQAHLGHLMNTFFFPSNLLYKSTRKEEHPITICPHLQNKHKKQSLYVTLFGEALPGKYQHK